ncbi:ABC transporter ATP-binding protein/permease [Acidimicrobiia bacterium]|jgi:ATP-binding cassette subfamily B protein|nr:ABC transporter ATP-binding protein/permease [Acidimicrobiia bacterium]MDB2367991.1 ABC transporter ATP-binding protein/permease [Candidatus Actinomarina sp.]MDB2532776.1 ABC transporter ATP-binding protein/permease [Candidatus Actinomarina sp.]MDB3961034.1 ABC transporter ATP-binding protein/permease [Acidimicrobiia bacterium]MDB4247620.1 ABC transporter ATP-binding protein/permease [Acidimicrobiia bacterium]|tara:strand:- start:2028 stop:3677 length:1650 start_codon:yes stop_codon:yes gene_type:complete
MIALTGSGLRMVGPQLISRGIDDGVLKSDYDYLLQQSFFYFITLVLLYFVASKALLAIGLVGESYVRSIREKLFRHLTSLDINYFEKNKTGVLVARMTSDMQSLNEFAREGASSVITALLTIFGATVAVFLVDVQLAFLSFLILPLLGVATKIFRNHADKTYWAVREWIGQVLSSLQEGISGVRIIQAYADEKSQFNRFEDINNEHLKANMQSAKNIAIYFPFLEITRVTSIAVVIWFASLRISDGTLSLGELVALLFYLNYFFDPLIQLSFNYDLLRSAGSSMKKVFSILDEEPVLSTLGSQSPNMESNDVIKFENVSFSYGRETVLHNLNFSIMKGEKIAIVGETGAGKSTIAKLILRFYLSTEGDVKFYNQSSKEVSQRWARKNIAYVPQESFLFRGTIRDNLIYSNPQKIKLEQELNEIGVLGWFDRYENGLDQEVGERGSNVSAGERQFIALLRAVLAKREIIVFDEATANLDIESENSILEATDTLLDYQTSIVIAHRLETILNAEKILVMQDGKLVGFDNHENLLSDNEIYKDLFSAWNLSS